MTPNKPTMDTMQCVTFKTEEDLEEFAVDQLQTALNESQWSDKPVKLEFYISAQRHLGYSEVQYNKFKHLNGYHLNIQEGHLK